MTTPEETIKLLTKERDKLADQVDQLEWEVKGVDEWRREYALMKANRDKAIEGIVALTKERDTLQYEVDAIPAIKAERDALQTALKNTLSSMGQQADELRKERDTQAKAADHWMTEATRDHNALVTLRAERDALMAAAKLALDAMAPMRGMILFDEATKALREAGVK